MVITINSQTIARFRWFKSSRCFTLSQLFAGCGHSEMLIEVSIAVRNISVAIGNIEMTCCGKAAFSGRPEPKRMQETLDWKTRKREEIPMTCDE